MRGASWLCLALVQVACFSEPTGEGPSSADGSTTGAATSSASLTPTTSEPTTAASSEGAGVDTSTTATSTGVVTSADASSDGGSETGDPCGPGARLIPPLPLGWDGPFGLAAWGAGGDQPPCPPPTQGGASFFEGAASACDCACSPSCWVNAFEDPVCAEEPPDFTGVSDGDCGNFGPPGPFQISLAFDDLALAADCYDPDEQPTLVADARHRMCLHVDGGDCFPTAIPGPCISFDDDVPCPPGPYAEPHLVAASGQPACAPCEPCFDAAVDACNAASAVVYPELDCMGVGMDVGDTTCSAQMGRSVALDVSLSCPETTALPPALDGVRTFCCVP